MPNKLKCLLAKFRKFDAKHSLYFSAVQACQLEMNFRIEKEKLFFTRQSNRV